MATLTKSTGTVTLSGAVEKVTLPAAYGWVWVKNMSEGNIFAGLSADISEGADGIMSIPSGEAGRIQMDGQDSVYLMGTGNALVVAQNYAECPFKSGVKGGGADVGGESSYTLKNAVDYPLLGQNLYGKSTQDGVPTPENPVEIVSVGDGGTVNITSNNGGDISVSAAITSALPLCGIPVADGGNYTDSTGQQWVCDEVIYNADGTGKIVKRSVETQLPDNCELFNNNDNGSVRFQGFSVKVDNVLCSHLEYQDKVKLYNAKSIGISGNPQYNQIVANFGLGNLESTKEFLSNNNVIVRYALAAPQEIPLTAAEISALRQLQTYNGVTNISNDGGADMVVKYCTNKTLSKYVMPITTGLQSQIDELKSAVLSLGGNI